MKIAIASGKGGTGKTTLAVNLARYAAEFAEVLLADLDVEEPNSGIFLKSLPEDPPIISDQIVGSAEINRRANLLNHKIMTRKVPFWQEELCNLCGKCIQWCRFNALLKLGEEIVILPELCHSCYACSELCPDKALPMDSVPMGELHHYVIDDLHFVESRLNVGVEQAVPLISQTISFLKENCPGKDLEFWDCPPGTSCSVMAAVNNADFVILVSEPTPFGLYDLGLAVEAMEQLDKPISVVINRFGIGNDDILEFCEQKKIPVWAKIANQRLIAELYARGELIYTQVPEFCSGMETILQQINRKKQELCEK